MVHHTSGDCWGLGEKSVYVKTQYDYSSRPSWRLWRSTPTFACERHALDICEDLGINTPRVLSFRSIDGVSELVLEDIGDALTLRQFSSQYPPERLQPVLKELGRTIGVLHGAGWTHGSIGGNHILVQDDAGDRVWLIDFEKARPATSERRLEEDVARFFRRTPYLVPEDIDSFFAGYGTGRHLAGDRLDRIAARFRKGANRSSDG